MVSDLRGIITIVPSDNLDALRDAIMNFTPDISRINDYVLRNTWDKVKINYD
jgi:hypothetical protein